MIQRFVVFNVLLYYTYAYLYFFDARLTSIRPVYWYFATLIGTAALVAKAGTFLLPRGSSRRLAIWALLFGALASFSFLWSSQQKVAVQTLIDVVEALALLVAFLYLLRDDRAMRVALPAIVFATAIGVALNIADFFSLVGIQFTTVPGRAAGLYQDSNLSGHFLTIGMFISAWVLPQRFRLWFCAFVGFGVLLTFSRSSMLLWAAAMIILAWYARLGMRRQAGLVIVGGSIALGAIGIAIGQMAGILEGIGLADRLTGDVINRVTGSFFSQNDQSTRGRLLLLQEGFRYFLQSPIVGNGLGSTDEWFLGGSTHNMYAMVAAEMGIIGLAAFLALLRIVWVSGTLFARGTVLLFALSSMFTHQNLSQVAMMIVLALAVSYREQATRSGRSEDFRALRYRETYGVPGTRASSSSV